MKVEGLEEGPRTPTKKEIQPSLNLDEIPSIDGEDYDLESDSLEDDEVNVDAYNFDESAKNGEILVITDDPEGALSSFRGRLNLELSDAVKRYSEYVTPLTNGKNADKTSRDRELTLPTLVRTQFDLLRSIQVKTGPSGESYLDIDEINNNVEKFYAELNSSYRAIAVKNGYQFKGINRKSKVGTTTDRSFNVKGSSLEYLSQKAENATNERLQKAYPKVTSGPVASLTSRIDELSLNNTSVQLKQRLKGGFTEYSRSIEFSRLMQDKDFESSMARTLASLSPNFSAARYFLSEEDFENLPKDDNTNSPEMALGRLEQIAYRELIHTAHKIYALQAVGGFDPKLPARRYFKSQNGDTIIALPESSDKKDLSPSVNTDYIQAAIEAIDRSVRPDKSSIVRKINFVNTSDYPGKVEEGELGHTNSATLEINIFMDRLSDINDKYNAAPPEEKDKMLRRFASPNAWDNMESLYKYTVAHELGHIMAFSIWDHKELNSNFHKSGPPSWRTRSGLKEMQKEINPLKQLEPISEYGKQSTDEYWAEAYAKWIVDNEASDSFKKILDDYGLIRGKARRWVTDETSSNPAARTTVYDEYKETHDAILAYPAFDPDKTVEASKVLERMLEDIPYLGEYGEEETKKAIRKLRDGLSVYSSHSMGDNLDDMQKQLYKFLRDMHSIWNGGDGSNQVSSIAMMYAMREMFDITNALPLTGRAKATDSSFQGRLARAVGVEEFFKQNPETYTLFKQILQANYNHTQRVLKDLGVEEVLVWRGWQGAKDIKNMTVVPSRPLNSFTIKEGITNTFASSTTDSKTAVVVKAKDVYGFFKLFSAGHGGEEELLVIGGAREMFGYDKASSPVWDDGSQQSKDLIAKFWDDIFGTGKQVLID